MWHLPWPGTFVNNFLFLKDDSDDLLWPAAMMKPENFNNNKLKIMTSIISPWKPALNVFAYAKARFLTDGLCKCVYLATI